ncbi:Fe-S-cluster-containing hydrogenase components 2 [Archaeoglobus sulfaticallidus PM70-1]|uniref:Fe-S-cluster-containing hydrogenase components 2 n=1 Tax=Archaeoglobus sulfaticallidus PM70-1 TaxID=387631 RepID=N0BIU5_9EURY|nr:Fe-S-cluster-containing hydrogenase components 2 [Archaeoglobus sulfaticallidus PM70-1]
MPKVVAKPEVCIGCHLCEIWCAVAHSRTRDILKAFKYEKKKPVPRIVVDENLPECFAIQCRHCDEPNCVFACISGALYKDTETGKVLHDESKCVGCLSCVMACPYGSIVIDFEEKKIVKCDLCEGLEFPTCVKMCPNNALVYISGGEE